MDEISVVELFAGVGGFRAGLRDSSDRFQVVWADQWEPGSKNQFAFKCYESNFGKDPVRHRNEDIFKVQDEVPDRFNLLVGGFPCQDYSVATTHSKGIEGKKGVLWWSIDHILDNRHPEYVLLENVDRLLKSPSSSQPGRDFGIILRCFFERGYTVQWRVINAANYGYPQKRRRIFIFACRNNHPYSKSLSSIKDKSDVLLSEGFFAKEFPVNRDFKKPLHRINITRRYYKTLQNVSDSFEGAFCNTGFMSRGIIYTAEVCPSYDGEIQTLGQVLEKHVDSKYSQKGFEDVWKEVKGPHQIPRKDKKTGFEYMYTEGAIPYPDNLKIPARTMLTSEGTRSRSSHVIFDEEMDSLRVLTPTECERLNGFPDDWTKDLTDRQRYFVMGNALVVGLVKQMGDEIIRIHDTFRK